MEVKYYLSLTLFWTLVSHSWSYCTVDTEVAGKWLYEKKSSIISSKFQKIVKISWFRQISRISSFFQDIVIHVLFYAYFSRISSFFQDIVIFSGYRQFSLISSFSPFFFLYSHFPTTSMQSWVSKSFKRFGRVVYIVHEEHHSSVPQLYFLVVFERFRSIHDWFLGTASPGAKNVFIITHDSCTLFLYTPKSYSNLSTIFYRTLNRGNGIKTFRSYSI